VYIKICCVPHGTGKSTVLGSQSNALNSISICLYLLCVDPFQTFPAPAPSLEKHVWGISGGGGTEANNPNVMVRGIFPGVR